MIGLQVDVWILTHMHSDHYGSIMELIQRHPNVIIKQFWRSSSKEVIRFMDKVDFEEAEKWCAFERSLKIPVHDPKVGEKTQLGSAKIEILLSLIHI